jgi:hypothetical protein
MRGLRAGLGALALIAVTASTASAQIELKNDDFVDMQAVTFHGGFGIGEMGASRFIPVGDPPYYIVAVRFLFGGAMTQQTITLRIYDDSGLQTNPGSQVFTAEYDVTGSDMAFQEIDLTLDNVQVSGAFRVGIEVQHGGAPSIANDTGGVDFADRNYLFSGIWYPANSREARPMPDRHQTRASAVPTRAFPMRARPPTQRVATSAWFTPSARRGSTAPMATSAPTTAASIRTAATTCGARASACARKTVAEEAARPAAPRGACRSRSGSWR